MFNYNNLILITVHNGVFYLLKLKALVWII